MLLEIKRIINFTKANASREEYFSRPVETAPLYGADYKRSEKIVHAQVGQRKRESPPSLKDARFDGGSAKVMQKWAKKDPLPGGAGVGIAGFVSKRNSLKIHEFLL